MKHLIENICLFGFIVCVIGFIISLSINNISMFIFSFLLVLTFVVIAILDILKQ